MTGKTFKRARSPEAKAKRRVQILQAAAAVLERDGLERCSLNAIAREAGVVKSNLYRYFESREEILLRLLLDDLDKTSERLVAAITGPMELDLTAQVLTLGFAQNPRLCLLISQLAPTLERNISTDLLREIKADLMGHAQTTAIALQRALPELTIDEAGQAIHLLFALVAGMWPISNPGPKLADLLEEPQFADLNQSFHDRMLFATRTLLTGLT